MKSEFMIERQGRQFALYAGILDEAHQQGLKRITTTLIQVPSPDNGNVAICACEVETDRGVFSGIGDASPANVAKPMITCLIRMAETRSKARAMRDAVNIGMAAVEETGEEDVPSVRPTGNPAPRPTAPQQTKPAAKPAPQSGPSAVNGPANTNPASEYVRESKAFQAHLLNVLGWEKADVDREMLRMITAQTPAERLAQLRAWRAQMQEPGQ